MRGLVLGSLVVGGLRHEHVGPQAEVCEVDYAWIESRLEMAGDALAYLLQCSQAGMQASMPQYVVRPSNDQKNRVHEGRGELLAATHNR